MITENDLRKLRCPMLGHEVSFLYCRAPGSRTPCRKIFDCWWEIFDIDSFMKSHFSKADIQKIVEPPPPKNVSLLDLIEQAKSRVGDSKK